MNNQCRHLKCWILLDQTILLTGHFQRIYFFVSSCFWFSGRSVDHAAHFLCNTFHKIRSIFTSFWVFPLRVCHVLLKLCHSLIVCNWLLYCCIMIWNSHWIKTLIFSVNSLILEGLEFVEFLVHHYTNLTVVIMSSSNWFFNSWYNVAEISRVQVSKSIFLSWPCTV